MHRVVIFADGYRWVAARLGMAILDAVRERADYGVVAICVPVALPYAGVLCVDLGHRAWLGAKGLFDGAHVSRHALPPPLNLGRLSRRHGFRVIVPPRGDANDPRFIAQLRETVRPTMALSLFWPQRFGPELLGVFHDAVNYHNGLLPGFRGLRATAWSMYERERETGFCFHRMTERLDEGPVLLRGAVPITAGVTPFDLEAEKTRRAAAQVPRLLQIVAEGVRGEPQVGEVAYHSWADCLTVMRVEDPSALTTDELARRIRAFGCVRMRLGGRWRGVTRLRVVGEGERDDARGFFRTLDGVWMRPDRVAFLPWWAYRAISWTWRWRKEW